MSDVKQILQNEFEARSFLTDDDSLFIYGKDWTTYYNIKASAVFFPVNSDELIKLIRLARKNRFALVPSGGRTGLSGAAVAKNSEVVVSFERMNKILDFNEIDQILTVEAGVVTKEVQNFLSERSYLFPIEFGATGSSQIGGNISTNAGGVNVVRYGNTRNWVAGLEVVTGAGDLLALNNGLVKNATGYDLRHLFIGSEGTLGFITRAQLKFTKQDSDKSLILLAVPNWNNVLEIYKLARKQICLNAFEVFTNDCLKYVLNADPELPAPFSSEYPLYALIEVGEMKASIDQFLDSVFEGSLANDGVQSQSSQQSEQIWKYRENITESISHRKPYKNDVSVRTSQIPTFVIEVTEILSRSYKDYELIWFGHIGDGNLHINILRPDGVSTEEFVQSCRQVDQLLFKCIQKFGGSISAEHGVGLSKKDFLSYSRDEIQIQAMRQIKKIFDPDNILNPGKIFD